ncbi:hypothetical protein BH23GEM9_BH23GEM9_23010 [soil metagenome]
MRLVIRRAALVAAGGLTAALTAARAASGALATALVASAVLTASGAGIPSLHAQAPDTAAAVRALHAFSTACRQDGGQLWGITLCGPVVLVDPQSRFAVANEADPDGRFVRVGDVYVGVLPAEMLVANTAVNWGGRRWAMALMPVPDSVPAAVALLAHESFHRIQPALGLHVRDPGNAHLAERDGRLWLRLELRALAAALQADGIASRTHIRNAMLFRAARHDVFAGADTLEAALELNEGLAEYTGVRLAYGDSAAARAAALARAFELRTSYVRALGYGTGPAFGLLLDRHAAGWRTRIGGIASLAEELRRSLGISAADLDIAAALATVAGYGHDDIAASEDARVAEYEARVASYRSALLDGPVLILRHTRFSGTFNPNQIVPLGDAGSVYPTGVFQAEWGRLEVTDGALVASDFNTITVAAPTPAALVATGNTIEGPGWILHLSPRWRIVPAPRTGSYQAIPPTP